MTVYRLVEQEKASYPVRTLCRTLGVSPSGYYAWSGQGLAVGRCAVELLMQRAGLAGLSGRPRFRRLPNAAPASDLVDRQFGRDAPDRLWVADIVRHEALSTVR